MKPNLYSLTVYVPLEAADRVREAIAKAGAGKMGNYDACSFSSRGTGRFRPLKGAKPAIGTVGQLEEVEEERIEVVITEKYLKPVMKELRKAHPYEEPAIILFPILDPKDIA